jgi:hypothetical protein
LYQTTSRHIPEGGNLYILRRDNLKSYLQFVAYNIDFIDNKFGKDVLPESDATSNRIWLLKMGGHGK